MKINFLKLAASVIICLLVGLLGSLVTTPSISTWYTALDKPFFNPPNWIFAPVWTGLFVLMGISLYIVWNSKPKSKLPFIIFGIQLVLNLLWSVLFFCLQSTFYSLIEILALWISILSTMIVFHRISKKASYLFIPYIVWVSFAALLNYYIFVLNL